MHVTRKDIIQHLRERLSLSEGNAALAVAGLFDAITAELAAGREVILAGFGKFYLNQRAPRTYTLPGGDRQIQQVASTSVRFKAFAAFDRKVNEISIEDIDQLARLMPAEERRAQPRRNMPEVGTAVVRVSGIPVCEFKIKDISDGGNAVLVEEDSMMLRNLRIGQEIDIWMNRRIASDRSPMLRAKIVHITTPDQPDLSGYTVLGIQMLE